jgi:hypothetical protein
MEINNIPPCLDNIETLGSNFEPLSQVIDDFRERTKWNRKRGDKITSKARQNDKTVNQVHEYLLPMDSNSKAFPYFLKLRNDLQNCCRHTLVRRWKKPHTVDFIAAHTCKNKACNVCNYVRCKSLRRKYLSYFAKNELIDQKTGEIFERKDFDFFHLTLTVPHSQKNGWRGKRVFVQELMKQFNLMRKRDFWKKNIFAGEFGIEFTKNKSGNHIHIHSLVIAHTFKGNRNYLYEQILKEWNQLTVCPYNERSEFSQVEIEAIKKGSKGITDQYVKQLHPKGSTFISLESLYTLSDQRISRYDRINENGKYKHYINPADDKQFIAGVMECIKYHFEPLCFNKEDKTIDFELLEEILPEIHGRPLYRKFGNFHGLKELNVNETDLAEEAMEDLQETGRETVLHPETGALADKEDYDFLIINARMLRYDKNDNMRPRIRKSAKKIYLYDCHTVVQALKRMCNMGWQDRLKGRTSDEIILMHEEALCENQFAFDEEYSLTA